MRPWRSAAGAAALAALCACGRAAGPGEPAPPLFPIPLLQAPAPVLGSWADFKGKAVVLEFWGVDCVPCVDAIPHMNALAEAFRDRPVVFLFVTTDSEGKVREFLKSRPMSGWIGLDGKRQVFDSFGVRGIPATFLVDPDGRIAGKSYAGLLQADQLEALLAGGRVAEPSAEEKNAAALKAMTGAGAADAEPAVVVRISPSAPGGPQGAMSGPGLLKHNGMPLKDLLSYAHRVPLRQLEADASLALRRYDVLIHAPGADEAVMAGLARGALDAFFPHQARKVSRVVDAFHLTQAPGPAPQRKPPATRERMGGGGKPGSGKLAYENVPVGWLLGGLEEATGRPVIDKTGLEGSFDLTLTWDPKDPDALAKALETQLGLRLAPAKTALEFLVVQDSKR